jgi:Protein of unknown function (DUF1592)/Protein of unknown function (DUF1588)/Protein of unknown function (DUF1587)/Protein of unknown function (DUF1585)/Protein of unknown function (DUF1595)/Ca-dependent carbohydrate-binding module xylan-binding
VIAKRLAWICAAALALAACSESVEHPAAPAPAAPLRGSSAGGTWSATPQSDAAPTPAGRSATAAAPAPAALTAPSEVVPTAPSTPAPIATSAAAPQAPAASVAHAPILTRQVGSATIRFWAEEVDRVGRDLFQYRFHATVQNGGSSLLRGALMVTSSASATRVAHSCAKFGTTPPGTTRDADGPFVIVQDRSVAFDPNALAFAIDATPDPLLCEDPGRVTLRRLNRAEYDDTVRDLLGPTQKPAADFPADDFGYGFDTIGDVLALSPLLFEKAENAATSLVDEALRVYPAASARRSQGESGTADCGAASGNAWNLWSSCTLSVDVTVPVAAEYDVRVRAWGDQAGPDPARMQIHAGPTLLGGVIDVPVTSADAQVYTVHATLAAGTQAIEVDFTNDYYEPPNDRNLYVDYVEIYGPVNAPATPPPVTALRALCNPAVDGRVPCTRTMVQSFTRKAWRRPPSIGEIDALVALADDASTGGATFDEALGVAMRAVLTSPHFLFRVERDAHGRSAESHQLTPWELATRLSYFLWASMPDAELDALADAGTLTAALPAQVHRMIQDPKARDFVDNYAGQWLGTRALDDVLPDPTWFPAWDGELKDAMRQETELFLLDFLRSDTDFLGFFDAGFTYVNDRLAQHYGLPLPGSTTPVKVTLPASGQRGGIFTQGSVLTVNSQPRRTSVVKRGKWALDQLLCIAIAPPPAGVPMGVLDAPGATGTLRERLAAHRAKPECAACHDYLDPIGLGLESYDAIGAWRTTEAGQPIDATGQFPDGRSFDGARQMAALVKADPNTPHCLAERLLIYALGRGLTSADDANLDAITAAFQANGRSFEDLIVAIVQSEPFRMRRGEPSAEETP